MALTQVDATPILLGSGELYLGEVANPETADETTIEAALTNVGAIASGASLEYKPTLAEVKSGNRGVIYRWITDEEILFKTGIITWSLDNLAKLSPADVSVDALNNTKRIGIGGISNLPVNYLRFVHTKPSGKKLTVNIYKAQNTTGFTLAFDKDKETQIDAEFKALATGKTNGNLVEIIEELEA